MSAKASLGMTVIQKYMSNIKKIVVALVVIALAWVGVFYYRNLRGAGSALLPPDSDITQTLTSTPPTTAKPIDNGPLTLPDGFAISVLAKKLPGARVLAMDSMGNLWVSQPSKGQITLVEMQNGQAIKQTAILKNLRNPHGLAFDPADPYTLYFAEETKISKVRVYSEDTPHKIADLPPKKGLHFTRTIQFGADGRLYVSIGSDCNVCEPSNEKYASMWSMNKDGSDFKQVAKGLRNSVFFVWNEKDNNIWATDMGRDLLGDALPPDEINIINPRASEVENFGWPICYGKNIHDTNFDKKTYIRNPCMEPFEQPSFIDIPAHSAPLGLAFIPANSGWPQEYVGDLLVAMHGSWNSTVPVGYKVVRYDLSEDGNMIGQYDFISGWIKGKKVSGRPVDLVFGKNGELYVSDDKAGVIYVVKYVK